MFRRAAVFLLVFPLITVFAHPSAAQQADYEKLSKAMAASYYRASNLAVMDCDVAVDWAPIVATGKGNVAAAGLKTLQGLKTHIHAVRQQRPVAIFNWGNGTPESKNLVEMQVQHALISFFRVYWASLDLGIVAPSSISKIEQDANGSRRVYFTGVGSAMVMTIDGNSTPTHYAFDSPTSKGGFDLTYSETPKPKPGDLRRLTGVNVVNQNGAATNKLGIALDYQQVDDLYVPHHVTVAMPGETPMPMELTGCSVKKLAVLQTKSPGK